VCVYVHLRMSKRVLTHVHVCAEGEGGGGACTGVASETGNYT